MNVDIEGSRALNQIYDIRVRPFTKPKTRAYFTNICKFTVLLFYQRKGLRRALISLDSTISYLHGIAIRLYYTI